MESSNLETMQSNSHFSTVLNPGFDTPGIPVGEWLREAAKGAGLVPINDTADNNIIANRLPPIGGDRTDRVHGQGHPHWTVKGPGCVLCRHCGKQFVSLPGTESRVGVIRHMLQSHGLEVQA